ncbi:MAG TPA: SDR family NAD(P)-dependent oxidoreductase [Candidatus Eisenbacteria bacterium]|jgi:NADP-dependent 3-hydroxy acid dehydrogenase YdfG|nr:SDR family NAD(P)-dependent oxidoreductase [Candidatus Eisenbacteria bacterium]
MDTPLKGRHALVTGASSGFGRAIASRFAAEGAHVAITGRRGERLDELAAELRSKHRVEVTPLAFDVRDRDAVESALRGARGLLDTVDLVVNNAGLAAGLDPVQSANPDDWEQMIDTNVKGLLWVTRAVLPGMIARRRGDVVNIGSVAGHQPYGGGSVYAATKFAVRAITDALRYDVLGTGVRVMNVAPGLAETEFSIVRFKGDESRAASVYRGVDPLTAEDVADAVVWVVTRPAHVNVQEILLLPTDQASAYALHRREPT